MMDAVGNKKAAKEIAMIKVAAPSMAAKVIDRAMQVRKASEQDTEFLYDRLFLLIPPLFPPPFPLERVCEGVWGALDGLRKLL